MWSLRWLANIFMCTHTWRSRPNTWHYFVRIILYARRRSVWRIPYLIEWKAKEMECGKIARSLLGNCTNLKSCECVRKAKMGNVKTYERRYTHTRACKFAGYAIHSGLSSSCSCRCLSRLTQFDVVTRRMNFIRYSVAARMWEKEENEIL